MPQLFLDCDGVLADFDGYGLTVLGDLPANIEEKYGSQHLWDLLERVPDFYYNLPVLPEGQALYRAVLPLKPVILTGYPQGCKHWAVSQKERWAKKNFPATPLVACLSREKYMHMRAPGDVLVDDRLKYSHLWTQVGGVFVQHSTAYGTILQLRRLGIL